MSRAISIVALLGTVAMVISILASMRGAFPVTFRLIELVAAITVMCAVIGGMVVRARERRDRS